MFLNKNTMASDIGSHDQALQQSERLRPLVGMDTLRLIFAVVVFLGHGGWPNSNYYPILENMPIIDTLFKLLGLPLSGTYAVVGFFIVSGFCIHYPNTTGRALLAPNFLAARMIRIGGPLIVIGVITLLAGPRYVNALHGVVWSIYCEIAYYALYPMMRYFTGNKNIITLLVASTAISSVLVFFLWRYHFLSEVPWYVCWLFCAPMWIAGAVMAQRWVDLRMGARLAPRAAEASRSDIWLWRAGAVAFGAIAQILVFHSPVQVGYAISVWPFCVFAIFWIRKELERFEVRGAPRFMENWGKASYSVYLLHMPIMVLVHQSVSASPIVTHVTLLAAVIAGSAAFYFLVEKPSHMLSRHVARAALNWRLTASIST